MGYAGGDQQCINRWVLRRQWPSLFPCFLHFNTKACLAASATQIHHQSYIAAIRVNWQHYLPLPFNLFSMHPCFSCNYWSFVDFSGQKKQTLILSVIHHALLDWFPGATFTISSQVSSLKNIKCTVCSYLQVCLIKHTEQKSEHYDHRGSDSLTPGYFPKPDIQ